MGGGPFLEGHHRIPSDRAAQQMRACELGGGAVDGAPPAGSVEHFLDVREEFWGNGPKVHFWGRPTHGDLGLGLGLDERGSHTGSHAEARGCCLIFDLFFVLLSV